MKKILLFTVPHTGTHTLHYLFNVLGGVKIYWEHFIPTKLPMISELLALPNQDDVVYLFTQRAEASLEASWSQRGRRLKGLPDALHMQELYEPLIKKRGEHFTMPIEGTIKERAGIAIDIMIACDRPIRGDFLEFIQLWPYLNTHKDSDKEDFMTPDRRKLVAESVLAKIKDYTDLHKEHT